MAGNKLETRTNEREWSRLANHNSEELFQVGYVSSLLQKPQHWWGLRGKGDQCCAVIRIYLHSSSLSSFRVRSSANLHQCRLQLNDMKALLVTTAVLPSGQDCPATSIRYDIGAIVRLLHKAPEGYVVIVDRGLGPHWRYVGNVTGLQTRTG